MADSESRKRRIQEHVLRTLGSSLARLQVSNDQRQQQIKAHLKLTSDINFKTR